MPSNPPQKLAVLCLSLLASTALAAPPKPPYARNPDITTEPNFRNVAEPAGSQYTEYHLKDSAVRKHAIAEVQKATGPNSFVARSLRVITGNGGSKIFETVTGQDGLTFGIKDFTSGGLLPLLQLIENHHPGAVKAAFGPDTPVLKSGWLAARTSAVNDHGLIALKDVRVGLDRILSNPQYFDEQLERFVKEAVDPSLKKFHDRNYRREFTLASMVGVANSGGAGGLERWLAQAEKNTKSKKEETVIPELMRIYTMRDAGSKTTATQDLLDKVFRGKTGALPDWDSLGHSGRRLRWLAEYFSWSKGKDFEELGSFGAN